MIVSFHSKVLERFWRRNDPSGIRPEWRKKVTTILSLLNAVNSPGGMDVPGMGFHPLTGDRAGRYAVIVSRNWRITFGWRDQDAVDVELEDYHG